jgi:hypothetical protein
VLARGKYFAVAVLLACGLAACAGTSDGPVIQRGEAAMSGLAVNPGTLGVFSASITASHPRTITLERITLLPLPGFRLPHLAHDGLLGTADYPARTLTWPPPGLKVRQLSGAAVWPAVRDGKPPPQVVYALSASGLGGYATAGMKVDYRFAGRTYSAVIRDAVFLWYFPRHLSPAANKADGARYKAANARAFKALKSLT